MCHGYMHAKQNANLNVHHQEVLHNGLWDSCDKHNIFLFYN